MKTVEVKVQLTEEMLGTASGNKELHSAFIASKAPDAKKREEEIAAIGVDAEIDKTMTVFPKDQNGDPVIWNYQIEGFLKEAFGTLKNVDDSPCHKMTSYKKKVDNYIFVVERSIRLCDKELIGNCQRPLRAETMQGPRVALANSETVPAGTEFIFHVTFLDESLMKATKAAFEYGLFKGFGQWRNSAKGRFKLLSFETIDEVLAPEA